MPTSGQLSILSGMANLSSTLKSMPAKETEMGEESGDEQIRVTNKTTEDLRERLKKVTRSNVMGSFMGWWANATFRYEA